MPVAATIGDSASRKGRQRRRGVEALGRYFSSSDLKAISIPRSGRYSIIKVVANGLGEVKPTGFLARGSKRHVILIEYDTDLVHESDLFFIVASQVSVLRDGTCGHVWSGVNVREKTDDIVRSDGIRCSCGR